MKKFFISILLTLILLCSAFFGCSVPQTNNNGAYTPDGDLKSDYPSAEAPDASYDGGYLSPVGPAGSSGESSSGESGSDGTGPDGYIGTPGTPSYKPGQLTAAAYFDVDYLDFFYSLIGSTQEGDGLFKRYYSNINLPLNNVLNLTFEGVKGGLVELYEDNNLTFTGRCDNSGRVTLLANDSNAKKQVKVTYTLPDNSQKSEEFEVTQNTQTFKTQAQMAITNVIELMLIIDTTGSMTDEINYLKNEITDVIGKIKEANEGVTIYLALMFYRDINDEYVTRYFDFTTNISEQQYNLSKQLASGGGDFEEAVDIAFTECVKKQWSNTQSTKIAVHVADAPSHKEHENTWLNASKKLSSMGVRVISVASSGINKNTEFLMRVQSLITGGCYVYLTDHSGIGGTHLKPTLATSPTIEHLNSLLIRLINGYHSGQFVEPIDYRQN